MLKNTTEWADDCQRLSMIVFRAMSFSPLVETIYTERANYTRDYTLENNIADSDGMICVGGDGMFFGNLS